MSSSVTCEKPFSATSRKAAFKSIRRLSASWVAARRAMPGNYLTSRSVVKMPCVLRAVDLRPMRVNLLYFASFRDAAGLSEQVRELPEGTRVGQLWEAVAREFPRLAAFPAMPPAA